MTALPKAQPKMPEPPMAHYSEDGLYKPDCKWSAACEYGQAMYEHGRQQMREECIAAIEMERLDVPKKRLHPQGRGYEMALDDVSIRIMGLP